MLACVAPHARKVVSSRLVSTRWDEAAPTEGVSSFTQRPTSGRLGYTAYKLALRGNSRRKEKTTETTENKNGPETSLRSDHIQRSR